jgi:hypothetical protein
MDALLDLTKGTDNIKDKGNELNFYYDTIEDGGNIKPMDYLLLPCQIFPHFSGKDGPSQTSLHQRRFRGGGFGGA